LVQTFFNLKSLPLNVPNEFNSFILLHVPVIYVNLSLIFRGFLGHVLAIFFRCSGHVISGSKWCLKSCSCNLFQIFPNFQVLFKSCSGYFCQMQWSCDPRVPVACSCYFFLFFCSLCAHGIRILIWCLLIWLLWSYDVRV